MGKMGGSARQWLEKLVLWAVKCLFMVLSVGPIPTHIAFIMDGNRRYAKKLNSAVGFGHKAGYWTLMTMVALCSELGVKYVTAYAFSIDNFKRQPEEVSFLMDLIHEKIEGMLDPQSIAHRLNVRVNFVGDLSLFDERIRTVAEKVTRATSRNSKTVLNICLAYTSCDEITRAVKEACKEKEEEGKIRGRKFCGVKLVDLERHLDMAVAPDPDIVVRSSGEMRLSNFLLWQTAYCSLYSPSAFWPELGLWHLVWAVLNFQRSYSYLEKKKKKA